MEEYSRESEFQVRHRTVHLGVKKQLYDSTTSMIFMVCMGVKQTLVERGKSRVTAVEMSYSRTAFGVTWWDGWINEHIR